MLFGSINLTVLSISLIWGCKSLKDNTLDTCIKLEKWTQQFSLDAIVLSDLLKALWTLPLLQQKKTVRDILEMVDYTLFGVFVSGTFWVFRDHQVVKSPAS